MYARKVIIIIGSFIDEFRASYNFIANILAQPIRSTEVNIAAAYFAKLTHLSRHSKQADWRARLVLHQQVDIALRSQFISRSRAKHIQTPNWLASTVFADFIQWQCQD